MNCRAAISATGSSHEFELQLALRELQERTPSFIGREVIPYESDSRADERTPGEFAQLGRSDRLTRAELSRLAGGRWFSSLSPGLRHDILKAVRVTRYEAGEQIAAEGTPVTEWLGCATGAMRLGSCSRSGRLVTIAYFEPGAWLGCLGVVEGECWSHDVHAQGATCVAAVPRRAFLQILTAHPVFSLALLRLQNKRLRASLDLVQDLRELDLPALLARQLLRLCKQYGHRLPGGSVRIRLPLVQSELADLVGASRQRINANLQTWLRAGVVQREHGSLLVVDAEALGRVAVS